MIYFTAIMLVLGLAFRQKLYDLARGKRNLDDIYLFNHKTAEMLKLDIPQDQIIDQVVNEAFSPVTYRFSAVGKALRRVLMKIRAGRTLGEALDTERKVFPAYYVDMIRIGEAEGDLVGTMEVLNSYLKISREYNISAYQLAGYLSVMILIFFGIATFLIKFIMPTFIELFGAMDMEFFSPGSRFIFDFVKITPVFVAIALFIYLGIVTLRKTKELRRYIDRITIKIPVIGGIIKNYEYMIFCRVMGNLLENYVPTDRALILAAGAASSSAFAEALKNAANSLSSGLADALSRSSLFDGTFLYMVSLGEKTEKLAEAFWDMAEYYSEDYVSSMSLMFKVSEICVTVFLGLITGFFVTGIFAPLSRIIVETGNSIFY